jgi:23S rRNA (adenine2030-N6)-methyltransferase
LWGRKDAWAVSRYLHEVEKTNPDGATHTRARRSRLQMLRKRTGCGYLHTTEKVLRHFAAPTARVGAGSRRLRGLKSVLPPASRRALVLIDPSCEDRRITAGRAAMRNAQALRDRVYAVWYPVVQRQERRMPGQLRQPPRATGCTCRSP